MQPHSQFHKQSPRQYRQRGFTLIETLIALLIMGVTSTTILVLISQNTRFASESEDRLMASILADNAMVSLLATTGSTIITNDSEYASLNGKNWIIEHTISQTTFEPIFLLNVKVRRLDLGSNNARADIDLSPEPTGQILSEISTLKTDIRP